MIEIILITISVTVGAIITAIKMYRKSNCKSQCCDVVLETQK